MSLTPGTDSIGFGCFVPDLTRMESMTALALARSWRPKTFRELLGQDHVVKALSHALDQGRLHHAWLFTGTRGV
eukprot:gene19784-25306_t